MDPYSQPPLDSHQPFVVNAEPPPPPTPRWKTILTPLIAALLIGLKFFGKIKLLILPALKFLPVLLKTGGSMFLMIWVYSMLYGWTYAAGFVILIFIHEMGHVLAAYWMKMPVTAPVFIPFIGAHILMKKLPPNAWVEAIVGIGGPILGTLGAMGCQIIFNQTHETIWLALAYSGYFLNLFNLIPLSPLDGGRICAALSPWLWLPGLGILVAFMLQRQTLNFVMILILLAAVPKVVGLFRKKTAAEHRYYEVLPSQRLAVAIGYFSLVILLLYFKEAAITSLSDLGRWQ